MRKSPGITTKAPENQRFFGAFLERVPAFEPTALENVPTAIVLSGMQQGKGGVLQRQQALLDREENCRRHDGLPGGTEPVQLVRSEGPPEALRDQPVFPDEQEGVALAQIQIDGKNFDTEICETTLYNWIYRGDIFLNLTEADLLYKGERRNEGRKAGDNNRARPAKGDTIEQRPEEINSRETFGNWEMDSVMGCKGSKAALAVLTERLTRYPVIVRVPDHTAWCKILCKRNSTKSR